MSRSVVVMLVAGAILLGVLAFVFKHYWPAIAVEPTKTKVLIFTLGGYGALLAAVMIRRIVEPSLDMPILAWLIAGVWMIYRAFHKTPEERRIEEENDRMNRTPDPEQSSSFGNNGTGIWWAIGLTVVGLGMYAAGITGAWLLNEKQKPSSATAKPKAEPAPPAPAPPPTKTTVDVKTSEVNRPSSDDITDLPNLPAAVAVTTRQTTADSEPSDGSKRLARWLAKKGTWADVSVAKSETSIELVEKDAASQRGKRLCLAGTLERIEKQTFEGVEVHEARVITAQKDAVEVYAVGRTGALVKRKPAKFCGVVTGAQRDGKAIVTFAVGMFDTNK